MDLPHHITRSTPVHSFCCDNCPDCDCDEREVSAARDVMIRVISFMVAIIVMGFVAMCMIMLKPGAARAHEATNTSGQPLGWSYPLSCCSLRDCRPAKTGEVRETPRGYELTSTGEFVGYQDKRIRESPSGDFHVCQEGGDFAKGKVLCLFAPGRGY